MGDRLTLGSTLYTIKVEGLSNLIRRADAADRATKRLVREGLRDAVQPVREEATRLFSKYSDKSAGRYRVVVRRTGLVAVEQPLRRTTGKRPDFARLQYSKALFPARDSKREEVLSRLQQEVEKVARIFD